MLEQRWRGIADRYADQWAVIDVAHGRRWSFAELAAAAAARPAQIIPVAGGVDFVCPTGRGVEFILELLRGWRSGSVTCPLEADQAPPALSSIPTGVRHLKMTSGTTGPGKVVGFTAAQLAADVDQLVPAMGLHPDSPNLAVLSLAHSYGFSSLVMPLLLHGIPLILAESALPVAVSGALAGQAPVTLPAVPALWRTWHETGVIRRGLYRAISAGAPLPLALEQAVFADCGLKLHNFLGATECGGIAYDRTEQPRDDASYIGTAIPGVRLATSPDGHLSVQGANVGAGYLATTGESVAGGFGAAGYVTADLAEVAADGGVWLRGRSGDVINVAGRKVLPEVIERRLLAHPAVMDCLVLGVPDPANRGECIGAAVVGRGAVSVAALRDFLLAEIPSWQVPRKWWWVAELTGNARGKRSRREWAKRLADLPASGS